MNNNNCGVCLIEVWDDDEIGCEGLCEIFFHVYCLNMTNQEYDLLRFKNDIKWLCLKYLRCWNDSDVCDNSYVNTISEKNTEERKKQPSICYWKHGSGV